MLTVPPVPQEYDPVPIQDIIDRICLRFPIAAADLGADSVDSSKVKDGTLVLADLSTAVKNAFLKLATAADLVMSIGNDGASLVAAATVTKTITHSLGRTPLHVLVTPRAPRNGIASAFYAGNFTATTFDVEVIVTNFSAQTAVQNFEWMAIG